MGNQIIHSTKDSNGFYIISFRKIENKTNLFEGVITKQNMYRYIVKNYKTEIQIDEKSDPFVKDFGIAITKNFIKNGSIFSIKDGDEIYFNISDFTNQNSEYDIEIIKRYLFALENNSTVPLTSEYIRNFTIPSNYTFQIEPNNSPIPTNNTVDKGPQGVDNDTIDIVDIIVQDVKRDNGYYNQSVDINQAKPFLIIGLTFVIFLIVIFLQI